MNVTPEHDLFGEVEPTSAAPGTVFAEIVFDRPLDHAFSYAIPDELRAEIAIGKRVLAPFGRGDRLTIGYCVGLSKTPPERAVKVVVRVIDDEALLTPDLLRLTRWMADYYLCGWGQVLNAVVPAGAKEQAGTKATTFLQAIPEAELTEPPRVLPPKQQAALDELRRSGQPIEIKQLARLVNCANGPLQALLDKGLARRLTHRVERGHFPTQEPVEAEAGHALNPDQERVYQPIEQALRQPGFKAFLLHGVTGSGKTEIYLRAIEEVIRQGKEAIVLVPEISLTPQTIQRFSGRCGEVAVLHSHLGNAERGGHWRRIFHGHVQVVVGARSAVFAPARKLGLIVIDEEHEGSFKQDSTPRYHARDVAVLRARLQNIPILLGSATPSLESWHNAERGQYTLLTMPKRVLDRPLPQVALLDLRNDPPRGHWHALSPGLEGAMRDTLRDSGQVLLMLNRRGYSTYIHCPSCGEVVNCQFCDLSMTYHRERDLLLCHYCGFEQAAPDKCPSCGQKTIRYQGLGTEKLQKEIEEKFPTHVIRRMDSDTMKQPGSHARVFAAFRKGMIDILLGTQMIAKGLDFPNVTLVGVVNADVGLHIPDFRSGERIFQLLAQVAGRTGRGPRGGKVLVQTYNPEHPCIALAARHDYLGFAAAELVHRRAHHYPPFERMARLIVRSRDQAAGATFAERLAADFAETLQAQEGAAATVRLLGPAEAPVFKLKGYFRYHFQLQCPSAAILHQVLRGVLRLTRTPQNVEFTVDIDPFNML